jgi:uncharacterized protein (TIGR03067 family)
VEGKRDDMRTRYLQFFGLLFLTACISTSSSDRVELKKLQGNWRLMYQQINGDKIPDEQAAHMFNGRMTFTGDKAVYAVNLPGFYFEFRCRIDTTKQPHTIDLETLREGYEPNHKNKKNIGSKSFGIYRLREDDLLICWNEQKRPNEFSAAAGTGNTLVVLKRK